MRIDSDEVENYACAMPRYYAIPLILINKQLTFYEAQCRLDGTPFPPSSSCGKIKQRELKEYSYLWRLRCRFLQAIFDMNHERRLIITNGGDTTGSTGSCIACIDGSVTTLIRGCMRTGSP